MTYLKERDFKNIFEESKRELIHRSAREISSNSIHFPLEGVLKIQIIDTGSFLLNIIIGIGIDQDKIAKLFQPFVQADSSISQ